MPRPLPISSLKSFISSSVFSSFYDSSLIKSEARRHGIHSNGLINGPLFLFAYVSIDSIFSRCAILKGGEEFRKKKSISRAFWTGKEGKAAYKILPQRYLMNMQLSTKVRLNFGWEFKFFITAKSGIFWEMGLLQINSLTSHAFGTENRHRHSKKSFKYCKISVQFTLRKKVAALDQNFWLLYLISPSAKKVSLWKEKSPELLAYLSFWSRNSQTHEGIFFSLSLSSLLSGVEGIHDLGNTLGCIHTKQKSTFHMWNLKIWQ